MGVSCCRGALVRGLVFVLGSKQALLTMGPSAILLFCSARSGFPFAQCAYPYHLYLCNTFQLLFVPPNSVAHNLQWQQTKSSKASHDLSFRQAVHVLTVKNYGQ